MPIRCQIFKGIEKTCLSAIPKKTKIKIPSASDINSSFAYDEYMDILKEKLKKFVKDREWDQFHNPKNLVLSLISETGELAEIFRWLSQEECNQVMQNPKLAQHIREELADVFNNLILLSMKLNIDLVNEGEKKLSLTEKKYPSSEWKGKAHQV